MANSPDGERLRWVSEWRLRVSLEAVAAEFTRGRLTSLRLALLRLPLRGLVDATYAKSTILLEFDAASFDAERAIDDVSRWIASSGGEDREPEARQVEIPVCYDDSVAPDLRDVADYHGLCVDEFIEAHASATYHVSFMGFTPGFAYLDGLPPRLATPRLETPRLRVPAGSVGIAGAQTGVYPRATAGGWRLIGRTPRVMFDPSCTPPALLASGDRVRFIPIPLAECKHAPEVSGEAQAVETGPGIRVEEPGMLTTVQDLGRPGHAASGAPRGGAADTLSLRIGNRLLGNDDGAAALEMTLTGGEFLFEREAVVLISGAVAATVSGPGGSRTAATLTPLALRANERLKIGPILRGARAYLCVLGGIAAAAALGSRSTNLVAGFGGVAGRALRAGDRVPLCDGATGVLRAGASGAARELIASALGRRRLRAVAGAQHDAFPPESCSLFWRTRFEVSNRSDRVGLRLLGTIGATALEGRMASEGMMPGAVQVPASGEPIALLSEHPTTGGYPVIACVTAVDLPALGQARPRDALSFEQISYEEARAQHVDFERTLDRVAPRC